MAPLRTERTVAQRTTEVGDLLEDYARRGVFKGFARLGEGARRADYRIRWHRDQVFDLRYEPARRALRFACVLPCVDGRSVMYREFRNWLRSRQSQELPAHRICDPARIDIRPYNSAGAVALTVRSLDGDMGYAVQRLIGLVHEIYLDFLADGRYFEWLVETFDLDPDNAR